MSLARHAAATRILTAVGVLLTCLCSGLVPTDAAAQENTGRKEVLRVFIDCANTWCDESFIRSELTFVNSVRDRKEADVHALITAQGTGGGGREYTVAIIGLGRFTGIDHRLVHLSTSNDTDDSIRRGIARVLRLGLVRYVVDSAFGSQLDVVHRRTESVESASKGARDPWNSWVFRASLRASGSGEESRRSTYASGSLSANRVTESWKVNTSVSGNYSHARYTFPEGDTYTSISKAWSVSSLVVKSVGPHWSAGARASVSASTYVNQDIAVRLAPAVEYNIYPYKDSTRRQLTINYALGLNAYDYREATIYEKMREEKLDETLTLSWDLRQPWGTTSTTFQASHYLPELRKHRLVVFTEADVRLFKGFSLFGYGSVSRIRNQLYLPKGEATAEEVLVRQRQLATSYQYSLSIGFSYSFGSIFNNVVNSRFQESGMY